jgi:transglutaminase-like putative cysteine protease
LLIKSEYDIRFHVPQPTPMVALLHLHPSVDPQLTSVEGSAHGDILKVEQTGPGLDTPVSIPFNMYFDSFGNRCSRFLAPAGYLRLSGSNIVRALDTHDPQPFGAPQTPVESLPADTLQFLLASRYCEVDRFGGIARDLFGHMGTGYALAAAIRDWVHEKVAFDYKTARSTKTAMDVFTERVGVCRDYQHLAVTLTRCMNIPARYVTGQIGDIRIPFSGPGDFSAWYQVWLNGQWVDMDARHNHPRLGRILMATGRDAADIAITTSFGVANLNYFFVESLEIDAEGRPVPLPLRGETAVDVPATDPQT